MCMHQCLLNPHHYQYLCDYSGAAKEDLKDWSLTGKPLKMQHQNQWQARQRQLLGGVRPFALASVTLILLQGLFLSVQLQTLL